MSFLDQQVSRYLAMAGVAKCKKQLQPRVAERVKEKKCLLCDKKSKQRGLCWSHYLKFNRTLNSLPHDKRVAFEQHQISEGRILAVGQAREMRSPNPFSME